MWSTKNQVLVLSAALAVGSGAVWASSIYQKPVQLLETDIDRLAELNRRLQQQEEETLRRREIALPAGSTPGVRLADPVPGRRQPATPPRPTVTVEVPRPAEETGAQQSEAGPVHSLALMGITSRDGVRRAWLVDRESLDRYIVSEGEELKGLQVAQITRESVVLRDDEGTQTVRLGQFPIPTPTADTSLASAASSQPGSGSSTGGVMLASGNASRAWRGNRQSSRRSWSRSNRRSSNRRRSNRRSSNFRRTAASPSRAMRSAFRSMGNASRLLRGTTQTATLPTATPNPQTARRLGIRFVGDGRADSAPAPVVNPQTERRTGSSSGVAFGAGSNQQSGNTRTQGNRRSTSQQNPNTRTAARSR